MKIIQMLIPTTDKKTRPGIPMNPTYITIHETDNPDKGANALAHARLQERGNDRTASWHFTVDDTQIIQSVPTNEVAYHAGDGHGPGNMESIAIEICVNSGGDFEKAKANAYDLIRYLMKKYNIPLNKVVPHQNWSGKYCPRNILNSGWDKFIAPLIDKPKYPGFPIKLGSSGDIVKTIQRKLGGLVVDGDFGPKTEAAVKHFQKTMNKVVDGIVGPQTWDSLFR
jgi:N-acetylmuramoyl-L-alanine amidase